MKVFSKEKYIQDMGPRSYDTHHSWVDGLDGKSLEDCRLQGFCIYDEWCVEVPSPLAAAADAANRALKAIGDAAAKSMQRPKYQIIIESDGDTTTATMTINGVEVKKAQTKRNPKDKHNWKIAAQMAFGRLWDTEKKKNTVRADTLNCRCVVKQPPQFREVKRYAKVGEYIKIINPIDAEGYYKQYDIRRVRQDGPFSGSVYIDGSPICVDYDEYVVLEGMAERLAGGGKRE